ncbi:AEC family transporter [Fusibacter ferrireducens]|uniref:AEC family transporter n=1 Tax=Fusibacter ferrireducens TaxID=2785058 RepID=A0ABR9ZNT9_9FIRM|nr:AEC family transporter [Fusibacter ferrireducens]MBF4692099.1 AEC family transporter [Fusibacter ferrireducens]
MSIFLFILVHNIAPIFILVGLGFTISKKFNLDIYTLSKLNFYLFMPAFIFVNLFTTKLEPTMLKILLFCMVYLIINDLISRVVSKLRHFDTGMANAFKNSIQFNNTGNIGLSLVTLVFSTGPYFINGETPYLVEAQTALIIVMVFTNISTNTLGFYNAGRATMKFKDSIIKIFSMPSIYAIPAALILKQMHVNVASWFVWPALSFLKDGLVAMALITLGVQLSKTKFDFTDLNVPISVFTRLIIGPILAILLIPLFGFEGVVAQTVFIAQSVPTAVNTALIAVEFKSNEDFATQAVVMSTIFSAFTLTFAIFISRILYPVF